MKIKKYLLYLLILIVAGAIAVRIFFAVKNSNSKEITEEQAATSEEVFVQTVQAEEQEQVAGDTGEAAIEEEPEVFEDYYTSSSGDFTGYTFKCPDGWNIYEEDSGQTVLLSNNGNSVSENIMIKVEKASEIENGPDGLVNAYLGAIDYGSMGEIEGLKAVIGDREEDIWGYYYDSNLTDNEEYAEDTEIPGEIDLMTFTAEGDSVYILKYMSSGIAKDVAGDIFLDFLENFEINSEKKGVKESYESGSMNILILGVDSGLGREWGRRSARSDINMILHINLETYGATIVTIPRDLWVPIPGHDDGKINGAHAIGGPELAVETFEGFSGMDIDNYIITDFDGFIPLIDALGGVTIEINEDLADGFSNCYLSKGAHHLNGEQTLALCRNRYRSGDGSTQGGAWAREREAAKVIKALYEQKTTLEKILALPAFSNFLLRYTWTDMSFTDFMRLLPVLGKIGTPEIELRGVPSYSKMIGKASAVVHYEEETALMFDEIKNQ